MNTNTIRRLATIAAIAAAIAGGAYAGPPATALPPGVGCQTTMVGIPGFGAWSERTLCDGPIRPDGSWMRARQFWDPGYQVPITCGGPACFGGYWQPEKRGQIETYPVTPDTVLPDEPGHINP